MNDKNEVGVCVCVYTKGFNSLKGNSIVLFRYYEMFYVADQYHFKT